MKAKSMWGRQRSAHASVLSAANLLPGIANLLVSQRVFQPDLLIADQNPLPSLRNPKPRRSLCQHDLCWFSPVRVGELPWEAGLTRTELVQSWSVREGTFEPSPKGRSIPGEFSSR